MKGLFLLIILLGICETSRCEVKYSGEGLRDPFFENAEISASTASSVIAPDAWVLNGILWSPTRTRAQVNGQFVKTGDTIGGMEIVSIDRKGVRFRSNNNKEGYLTRQGIQWT